MNIIKFFKNLRAATEQKKREAEEIKKKEEQDREDSKKYHAWIKQFKYQLMKQVDDEKYVMWTTEQAVNDLGELSDGCHTFNELYDYRMLYNAAFFNLLPKEIVHKSKRHHDGEECFEGGWFIVMANLPTGQISNHYAMEFWDLFKIPEKEIADEWDGHTPQEAAERLRKYIEETQA